LGLVRDPIKTGSGIKFTTETGEERRGEMGDFSWVSFFNPKTGKNHKKACRGRGSVVGIEKFQSGRARLT